MIGLAQKQRYISWRSNELITNICNGYLGWSALYQQVLQVDHYVSQSGCLLMDLIGHTTIFPYNL